MRPLDRIGSIKVKLSLVIVVAVGITAVISVLGWRAGIPLWLRPIISATIAVALVYPFSRGITSPLREMSAASRAMAHGDYAHPVTSTSRDEVGDLARAFDAMREELSDVDRQRRDLVANVAHELRTPLAGLRARFENIADGVEGLDDDNVVATLAEVERLSRLLDQLLDLSRIESGTVALQRSDFDLAELLDEVATEAATAAPRAEIRVCAQSMGVYADRPKLRQVVANLTQNALRHSPDRETVLLSAHRDSRGFTVVVSDRGPGIPETERQRVLERFYRVDHGRASDGSGAGLGLAIANSIVELHGGSIHIGANQPTGCEVSVSIPRQPGETT